MFSFVNEVCLPLFRSLAFIPSTFTLMWPLVACLLQYKSITCTNSNLMHALHRQFMQQLHRSVVVSCTYQIKSCVSITLGQIYVSVQVEHAHRSKSSTCNSSRQRQTSLLICGLCSSCCMSASEQIACIHQLKSYWCITQRWVSTYAQVNGLDLF